MTGPATGEAPVAARDPEPRVLAPMGAPPPPLVEANSLTDLRAPWAAAVTRAQPLVLAIRGVFERVVPTTDDAAPDVAIRPAGMTASAGVPAAEPLRPATSSVEAQQIYDRLAAGMLDDLPPALGAL
jgi:hypothetical protein